MDQLNQHSKRSIPEMQMIHVISRRASGAGLFSILLLATTCRGEVGVVPPLKNYFEASDTVLLGTISNVRSLSEEHATGAIPKGNLPERPIYPCQFDLHVEYVVKSLLGQVRKDVQVLWFVPSQTCRLQYYGFPVAPGQTLIWFLRTESNHLRTVVDNGPGAILLEDLSTRTLANVKQFGGDPKTALSYLLLSRGIEQKGISYSDANITNLGAITTLAGWTGLITTLSQLYKEANPATRDEICLLASHAGMCLSSARRAVVRGVGEGQDLDARYPYLDERRFREFEERELRQIIGASSLSDLRKQFGYLDHREIKDYLAWHACTSSPRLRARARELLLSIFEMKASQIPCIPCERHTTE